MTLSYAELMMLIWVLWGVALILTVLRGVLRWRSRHGFFGDDYLVFFGLSSLTGDYQKAVMDDPQTSLPLPLDEFIERTRTALKFMFTQMLLFWTTLWAAKFSILYFFKRVVQGLPRYMKACWGCFFLVLALYLASMASNFLTCRPLTKYWSANLRSADISIKFATSADVVADILIMILPLHLLRKIQVSPRQKIFLAILFSLGTIIIAFAITRLIQVTKATSNPDPGTSPMDPSY